MRRLFAVALSLACVAAATPGFAQHGIAHGIVRGADPMLHAAPVPQVPDMTSRIPAPMAPPAQAPVINGPLSQHAFRGLTGIGQQ